MISSIFNYFLVVAFSLWVWWRAMFIWTATSSWREPCFTLARSSRMDDYLVLEGKASLKNYDIEGPASVISHISKNLKLFFEQFNAIFDHPSDIRWYPFQLMGELKLWSMWQKTNCWEFFFPKLFYFYIEAFPHWTLLWLIHFIVEFHFTELFAQREEIFITSSKSFKRTEWPSLIAAWQLAST